MERLPDYLEGKARAPESDGPSRLLNDGQWCGHGEPHYAVFDIWEGSVNLFGLRLPVAPDATPTAPVVLAELESGASFFVYDAREHPASIFHPDNTREQVPPRLLEPYHCANCGNAQFRLSVGFEIPDDSSGPNDTSWFALAVRCAQCGWEGVVYDDETA